MSEILNGKEIGGCKIIEEIGHGASSTVYKAIHINLNAPRAIKFFKPVKSLLGPQTTLEESKLRFEKEARLCANFSHPSLVAIHNVGIHDETPYIEMELVDGEELTEYISKGIIFPEHIAAAIILKVSKALDYAYNTSVDPSSTEGSKVIHRDIKPENIIITPSGLPKILDFGIAKQRDDQTQLTQDGALIGTPAYMSPEALAAAGIDFHSDIYSLGAVLFELITGEKLFNQDNPNQIIYATQQPDYIPNRLTEFDISKELKNIILICLAKDAFDRFETTKDLPFSLDQLLHSAGCNPDTELHNYFANPRDYHQEFDFSAVKKEKTEPKSKNKAPQFLFTVILLGVGAYVYHQMGDKFTSSEESFDELSITTNSKETTPDSQIKSPFNDSGVVSSSDTTSSASELLTGLIPLSSEMEVSSPESIREKSQFLPSKVKTTKKASRKTKRVNYYAMNTTQKKKLLQSLDPSDPLVLLRGAINKINQGNEIESFVMLKKAISSGGSSKASKSVFMAEANYYKTLLMERRNRKMNLSANENLKLWKSYLSKFPRSAYKLKAKSRINSIEDEL